jgi:hypothetical protein
MASETDDISKKLDGILGIIQSKKEESQSSGTPWGWITAAIASILAFVGLAFAAYDVWKKGRQVAKLQHDADVQEELKTAAEVNAKLATEAKLQQAQQMVVDQMQKNIEKTKELIAAAEQARKDAHAKIDQVTNWADFDQLVK